MVKVHAPVLSQDAAGRLAGTLVFQHHKRGTSLKKLTKPKQPRTPLQHNTRALVRRLGAYWTDNPQDYLQYWNPYALSINKDPYRAYMHLNLMRWRRNQGPATLPPGRDEGYTPTFDNFTCTAQGRRIHWTFDLTAHAFSRHVVFWAQTVSGEPADYLHVEQVEHARNNATFTYLSRPLTPALYRCWIQLVDIYGNKSIMSFMEQVDFT